MRRWIRPSPAACTVPTTAAHAGAASTTRTPSPTGTPVALPRRRTIPDTVYTVGQSIRRCDQGGAHCEIVKGRAGRRRLPPHLDQPAPPGPPDHRQRSGRGGQRQRRPRPGAAGTTSRRGSSTTWPPTTASPTGSTPASRTAAPSASPAAATMARSASATGILSAAMSGTTTFPIPADPLDRLRLGPRRPGQQVGRAALGRCRTYRPGRSPATASGRRSAATTTCGSRRWSPRGRATPAIYLGAQVLFRSADQGRSWSTISPDLTGKTAGATGCDGDVSLLGREALRLWLHLGGRAVAPAFRQEIWVGDRRRPDPADPRRRGDAGRDVTPPSRSRCGPRSRRSTSPLSRTASAYAVIDGQRLDDFQPHVLRTRDYGRHLDADHHRPARRPLRKRGTRRPGSPRPALRRHGRGRLRLLRRR